jgi:urate oxidase
MSYYNTYNKVEGFTDIQNKKTYILLGDSILKNDVYVSNGKSIENLIAERNKNIHNFAQDHSKIVDIYSQINNIPMEFDSPSTLIFLSAGGNDILTHYVDQNQDITDTSVLKPMFSSYKNIIKTIQARLPNAKIFLLDIYYPANLQYKQFHYIIKEWNSMIYDFAENPKNKIYGVIRISSHLTQNEDFSFGIEPSSSGGNKIADLILGTY